MAFIEMTVDNLNLFLNKLRAFDRYYTYSDDPQALARGQKQEDTIKEYCENIVFQEIYDMWLDQTATNQAPLDEDEFYRKVLLISSKSLVEEPTVPQTIQDIFEEAAKEITTVGVETKLVIPPPPVQSQVGKIKYMARAYLNDDFASTHYILHRGKDLSRLYPILKWKESSISGVVFADIYECRVTKGFNGPGNPNNTIASADGVLHYVTENCLLAYLLAAFW